MSVLAALVLLASGQGVRQDLWSYRTGLGVMLATKWLGLLALAMAGVSLALPAARAGRVVTLLFALVIGLCVSAVPFEFERRARSVPRIHDITTDTRNPPQFAAVLPLRAGAPNTAAYGGAELAELQRKAYPDIQPLVVQMPTQVAFSRARDAAEGMGWQIVAADASAGRIEATARTFWFGFKDDVVVRIVPEGTGSRIDVRSVSRVGRSDLGTNARRIREYLDRVRNF
ncbi:MAG TPA: DUF1499 domain-containing protein [Burkholderiales bacterium]